MKRILKKIIGMILIIFMCFYSWSFANLTSEKNKINNQIDEAKDNLQDVQTEKSDTLKNVEELKNKINTCETELKGLETQINEANQNIKKLQEKIDVTQKQYQEQSDLLDKRLVTMYEAGNASYLDLLLSSGNLTELISNYYLVSTLALNDTELLNEIEKARKQIEEDKEQIEKNKISIETAKKNQEVKRNELKVVKQEKDKKVSELSREEQDIQKTIQDLEEANKSIDAKILAAAEAEKINKIIITIIIINSSNGSNNNNNSGNASSAGFIRPVSGFSITTGLYYSDGSYHGAVDYSGNGIKGTPIKAVADGTVVISERLQGSYGNYILINHHNGLYTLYAHGLDGSRTVSEGDKVKQGQTIMKVGTTGNSTGYHLHFEVRKSPGLYANRIDPRPYLP